MPFTSSYWTISEALVWINKKQESLVDSLDLSSFDSSMHFFLLNTEKVSVLSWKERRATEKQLIEALADSKLRATGVSAESKARVQIPGEAWLNMKLVISMPRPVSPWSQYGLKVWTTDGSIEGELRIRDKVIDCWHDIRLYRSEIMGLWAPTRQPDAGASVVTTTSKSQAPDSNDELNNLEVSSPQMAESGAAYDQHMPTKTLVIDACNAAHKGELTPEMLRKAGNPPEGLKTGNFDKKGNRVADAARWISKAIGWPEGEGWRGTMIEKSLKEWRNSQNFPGYSKNRRANTPKT